MLCFENCFIWLRDLENKKIRPDLFEELLNMVLEENGDDTMSEIATNEQVLNRIGEKRTLLNNILRRKANWISHTLKRNGLNHDAIAAQMTELK